MSKEESKKSAISNFVMKVCGLERYAEIKRQMLCDKNDFEPYVAFQRLTRSMSTGITSSNIQRFLSENLIDLDLERCRNLLGHYDADKDGLLSYKEFLEIVLPKEHPDLRAFVTQRECYDIKEEEYLSYETEAALAILLEKEISIFEEALTQKQELDNLALSGHKIVELIDGSEQGNLNFNNLQKYLHSSGLMPYDSEIISFLRRVDRDDDGVISGEELERFLERFLHSDGLMDSIRRRNKLKPTNESRLKTFSPGRTIVHNKLSMLNPINNPIPLSGKANKILSEVTNRAGNLTEVNQQRRHMITKTPTNKTPTKKNPSDLKNGHPQAHKMKENRPYHRSHHTPQDVKKIHVKKELRQTSTTAFTQSRQPMKTMPDGANNTIDTHKDETRSIISHTQSYIPRNQRKELNLRNMQLATNNQTLNTMKTLNTHKNKTADAEKQGQTIRAPVVIKGTVLNSGKPTHPHPTGNQPQRHKNRSQLAYNRSRDRLYKSKKILMNKEEKKSQMGQVPTPPPVATKTPTPSQYNPAPGGGNPPPAQRPSYTRKMAEMGKSTISIKTQEERKKSMISTHTQPVLPHKEDRSSVTPHSYQEKNKNGRLGGKMHRKRESSKKKRRKRPVKSGDRSNKKKSAQKNNEAPKFVEIFGNIIEEEKLLEDARRRLTSQQDFYPDEIFKMIDRRQRGKFSFEEFRFFLSQIGVIHTDSRSLVDLYSSFDSNQNCFLGQKEVNEMLKSRDPHLEASFDRKAPSDFSSISQGTVELIATCFNRLFSLRKTVIKTKRILKESKLDLNLVFEQMDHQGKGFLDKADFLGHLKKAIPEFAESPLGEVGIFVDKCDLDKDGKVNFKDFYMFFSL